METKIKVETIGYYHRDSNMAATPDLPLKKINENRRYFEKTNINTPFVNLNIEIPNSEEKEFRLESFLDYIRQKGWPNGEKPDFVTDRRLLTYISSHPDTLTVHIFRMGGVIYLIRVDEDYESRLFSFSVVFKHFLTKTSDDEPIGDDGIFRKSVFKATVPIGRRSEVYSIMYCGNVAAIDDTKNQHCELKLIRHGLHNRYFWKNNSCRFYWQSVFGNVPTLIVGIRTAHYPKDPNTRDPFNYPELSLFKIEQLKQNVIPLRVSQFAKQYRFNGWTITEGETNLQNFLRLVKDTVKSDGDCFVFSRNDKYSEWIINRDENAVAEFRDVIIQNIPAQ